MLPDKEQLLKALLQYNYFPLQSERRHELPPIVNSTKFSTAIAREIASLSISQARKNEAFDHVSYKLTRHPNIPRLSNIPHPKPYADLCCFIHGAWDDHIAQLTDSRSSAIKPRKHEKDPRVILMKYGEVTDSTRHILRARHGKRYVVHTDIANFFPSIYTHSIPWASVGHEVAKKERHDRTKWFNELDKRVRFCKRNETAGVAIGPATSNIVSEIILGKIDSSLLSKGYNFYRYIDDYRCYCETLEQAERFVSDLSALLELYSLKLNIKKTHIHELPEPISDGWLTELRSYIPESKEIDAYKLINFMEKAIDINSKTPDGSTLKFALTTLLSRVTGEEAHKLFDGYLFDLSFHYPSLISLINRWMNKCVEFQDEYPKKLEKLLLENVSKDRPDAISWVLYYYLKIKEPIRKDVIEEVYKSKDCITLLLAYLHGKKYDMLPPLVSDLLMAKDNYDLDQYWLLIYQLYYEDKIAAPYKDTEDNRVFEVMKTKRVTFVHEHHFDMQKYTERYLEHLKKIFGMI